MKLGNVLGTGNLKEENHDNLLQDIGNLFGLK